MDLNGVVTAAHVVEGSENEVKRGVYFVPNNSLDPSTGFPSHLPNTNILAQSTDLIAYLQTSINSFEISSYSTTKKECKWHDFISRKSVQ